MYTVYTLQRDRKALLEKVSLLDVRLYTVQMRGRPLTSRSDLNLTLTQVIRPLGIVAASGGGWNTQHTWQRAKTLDGIPILINRS